MKFLPLYIVIIISLQSCFFAKLSLDNQITYNIKSLGSGVYIIDYKWTRMKEAYAKSRSSAVRKYLRENDLIPSECVHGVSVVRSGETEGGWGWSEFQCK